MYTFYPYRHTSPSIERVAQKAFYAVLSSRRYLDFFGV